MRFQLVPIGAVSVVVFGCGDWNPRHDPDDRVVVRDSAGVAIVENESDHGTSRRWSIAPTPVLEIGRVDGEGPDVFGSIRHAISLRTGEIVVADASNLEIRIFSERGRHLATVGRKGDGPGEFNNLWWITQTRGDSIFAVDNLNARISVFARTGEFRRSYSIPRLPGGSAPNIQGVMQSGHAVFSTRSTSAPAATGRSNVIVYTVDPDGNIATQLGEYPDRELGRNGLALGFGGAAEFAVGDSGIWFGNSRQFEIRTVSEKGVLVRIVRMNRPATAVTEEQIAHSQSRVEESLRRQGASERLRQRVMETEFASTHPVFERMMVDDAGRLWILRYTVRVGPDSAAGQSETWDVFDHAGRFSGFIVLPSDFRATEVKGDLMLGVQTDASGAHLVRQYRIEGK